MKKLFLTSGIIACMACPAFADPGFPATNGAVISDGDGACVNDVIGTYANSTTLVANWNPVFGVMALDENDGSTTATGGSEGATYDSTGTNNSLFLTPYDSNTGQGAGVYKRSGSSDSDYVFSKQSTGDTVITVPTGIPVNYSITDELPIAATTVSLTTSASSDSATRQFLGYYAYGTTTAQAESTTNPATKLINENGALTGDGVTAAENYNNANPWVALYSTVKPTNIVEPDAYGYHFTGWHVGDDTETLVSTVDLPKIGQTTDIAAVWAPDQYKLAYSCRNAENSLGIGTPSANPASNIPVTFDATFTWASNTDSGASQNCHHDGYHFTGWSCTATVQEGRNTTTLQDFSLATSSGNMSCSDDSNPGTCTGGQLANFNPAGLKNGASITCNAVYEKNVITITWTDPAGGTQGEDGYQNSCTYTEDVTIPENPSRPGYQFTGWTVSE